MTVVVWSLRAKIRLFALYSRLFIFALQFFSNHSMSNYETKEQSFTWIPIPELPKKKSLIDEVVTFFLDGFKNHESQMVLHVANNGYVYDNTLKIFPGFPLLLKGAFYLSDNSFIHHAYLMQLLSFLLNMSLFILSSEVLYSLSRIVLKDEYLAYKTALLFCINPSSVFFSAHYPETLYTLSLFLGLYFLEKMGMGILSGIFFAVASFTKDIGFLNSLFIVYLSMKNVAVETILFVRKRKTDKTDVSSIPLIFQNIWVKTFFPGICNVLAATVPFAFFQWFAYTAYCVKSGQSFHSDLIKNGQFRRMPPSKNDNVSSWCSEDTPISFFHIHYKYGSLGLSQFEDIDELPLILLSLPVIAIISSQIYNFLSVNRRYSLRLGLIDNALLGIPKLKVPPLVLTQSLPREVLIYLMHSVLLVLGCILVYPIQEVTRHICSGSPLLYWIAALATTPSQSSLIPVSSPDEESQESVALKVEKRRNLRNQHATILLQEKECSDLGNWIKLFFLSYFLFGTVLFANNFPWT